MSRAWEVSAAALLALGCGGKTAETPPYQCPPPQAPVGTISGTLRMVPFTPAEMVALLLGPATCKVGTTNVNVATLVVGLTTSPGLCDSLQKYGFCWDRANATMAFLEILKVGLVQSQALPGPGTYPITIGTPGVDQNGNGLAVGALYDTAGAAPTCTSLASSDTSASPATGILTLTTVTSTSVSGSANLTFVDGSALAGTFTAPVVVPLGDVCQLINSGCPSTTCVQ